MSKIQKELIPSLMPNPPPKELGIKEALLQKALGYTAKETIEEYTCENDTGHLVLCKKKVTTKQYPPDLEAVEKLMELNNADYTDITKMTDYELQEEREKLIKLIQNEKGENV